MRGIDIRVCAPLIILNFSTDAELLSEVIVVLPSID
jgi:hypothetical protein